MGFLSWITSDTQESIPNYFSEKLPFTVHLLAPDGQHIKEDNYEGYGAFGGKDVFAQWMLWNYPDECTDKDEDTIRSIFFDKYSRHTDCGKINCIYPIKLATKPVNYFSVQASEACPNQGYFYDRDD